MAERPWAQPDEIRAYTDRQSVKDRTDAKLAVDISRAEQYVINYTRCKFDDPNKFPVVPASVKTAVILLAETYAANAASLGAGAGVYKSESFDDYSYTTADTSYIIGNLDLGPLLDEFIQASAKNTITMRMRKL